LVIFASASGGADTAYKVPTANPTFTRGSRINGTFTAVQTSNNTYMRVREARAGTVWYLNMNWNGWQAFTETSRDKLVDIYIELEGYQQNTGDNWYVQFYNYNSGAYDTAWYLLGTLPTSPEGTLQVAVGDAGRSRTFVSAAGQFRLRLADGNTVSGGADAARTDLYIDLLRARFVYDIQPPVSAITAPADLEQTNATSYVVRGTSSDAAPDPSGVSLVEVSLDGMSWNAATPVAPGDYSTWSYSWGSIPAEGTYTIRSRARDGAGNQETPGAGVRLIVDWTPPQVGSTTPPDGAINVGVATNVQAAFLEANDMQASTINTSTFTVMDEEGSAVSGAVTYDPVSKTAAFDPDADFLYGYTYTVNLTTGITDLAGNPLASAYTWTFRTADILSLSLSTTYNRDGTPGGGSVSFGELNPEGSPFVVGGGTPPYAVSLRVLSSTNWNLLVRAVSDLEDNAQIPAAVIPISRLQWRLSGGASWVPFSLLDTEVFQPARTRTAQPGGSETTFDLSLDLDWEDPPGNYSTSVVFILMEQL
jgi:hypothetical protein